MNNSFWRTATAAHSERIWTPKPTNMTSSLFSFLGPNEINNKLWTKDDRKIKRLTQINDLNLLRSTVECIEMYENLPVCHTHTHTTTMMSFHLLINSVWCDACRLSHFVRSHRSHTIIQRKRETEYRKKPHQKHYKNTLHGTNKCTYWTWLNLAPFKRVCSFKVYICIVCHWSWQMNRQRVHGIT